MHNIKRPVSQLADMGELRLLRLFLVLVEERSVSRAAARLEVVQPSVSHALARLRRLFDDPLLVRTSGGMEPTARCLELRTQVHELLEKFDRLVTQPKAFDPSHSTSRFTIMAPEFASDVIAPRLLRQIAHAPHVEVEFITTDPVEAMGLLEQGIIDFRLGWWPEPAAALRRKLLWTDRMCCIVRRGSPIARPALSAARYLAAQHVRVRRPGRSYSMASIDAAAGKSRGKLQIAAWVQNAHILAQVVAATDLVGTLSERLAHQMRHLDLETHPLPLDVPALKVALYWHERTHASAAHKWLRGVLVEAARGVA